MGDIATGDDGKPSLHLHALLGLSDGMTRGGHFLKGIVRPTLEVTIVKAPARLRRHKRPELGIALIDLSKSWRSVPQSTFAPDALMTGASRSSSMAR